MWRWIKLYYKLFIIPQGLMSQRILYENELNNTPVRKLKSLAVQTRIEAEFINGRKQGIYRSI